MQAYADHLGRLFPDRDVELIVDPEGHISVRVDHDYWRIPDDDVGVQITRYEGDLAHVIRLDDNFNEVGAWTVRIGGDPGMN